MATANQTAKRQTSNANHSKSQNESAMERLITYFKGVRAEWGKISWPTWPQIWGQTIVVLVMVTLMTFILFIMDYSFHTIITLIVPHKM